MRRLLRYLTTAIAALLLASCATSYPATQALTCVRSSLPVVPPAVHTVTACLDAHRGNESALALCVAGAVATAVTALDAVAGCLPREEP